MNKFQSTDNTNLSSKDNLSDNSKDNPSDRARDNKSDSFDSVSNKSKERQLIVIILTAGKGTRMPSKLEKVMYKIGDYPMIDYVLSTAESLNPQKIIIVKSSDTPNLDKFLSSRQYKNNLTPKIVIQHQRLGTGHAVLCSLDLLKNISNINSKESEILILYGDTPFISITTCNRLIDLGKKSNYSANILGFITDIPNKYGRLILDSKNPELISEVIEYNMIEKIEDSELCASLLSDTSLLNSGIIYVKAKDLLKYLPLIPQRVENQEYYLTDLIKILNDHNKKTSYLTCSSKELLGINTNHELTLANQIFQQRHQEELIRQDIIFEDINSVYIGRDVSFGTNVVIESHVSIKGKVNIGNNVTIKSFSYIESDDINKSITISNNTRIGPFARIRENTIIKENCHIGNFCEIKNSTIEANNKINHISYIGDTYIDSYSNIGAGTITCNYNGSTKEKTKIGSNCFIGANSTLIAPITIEDNSLIAAGSVISKNVASGDLALSRTPQKNLKNLAKKYLSDFYTESNNK